MRRLIWVLLALPVLLVAAAFLVPAVIDWTEYRERIEARVAEVSGLQLDVRGGIAVSILPEPRLRLQDVVWSDPDGGIATVPQIEAALTLGNLLEGEARVERLSLVAPELVAGRETRFLQATDSLLAAPLLDSLIEIEIAGAAWSLGQDRRLVIDRLLIERSLLGGQALYRFDLLGEAWLRPLSARGSLSGFGTCSGPLSLEAQLEGVLQQSRFQGEWRCGEGGANVSGLLSAEGPDLAALLALAVPQSHQGQAPLAFSLDGPLAWQSGVLDAPSLSLGLGQQEAELRLEYRPAGELTGEVRVPLLNLDGPDRGGLVALAGQIEQLFRQSLSQVSLDLLLDNWRFRDASGGRSEARLAFQDGRGSASALEVTLPNASSLSLTGNLALAEEASATGKLVVQSEDLRGLLLWLGVGPDLLPPERLRRLSLKSDFNGSLDDLRLQDLRVELDALTAQGQAAWQSDPNSADLHLSVDALNLDAYGGLGLVEVVEALAGAISLNLALTAESVTLGGISGEQLNVAGKIGREAVTLERFSLDNVFNATLEAVGAISLADRKVTLDLELDGPLATLPSLGPIISEQEPSAGYRLSASLEGPLTTPALAGQLDALGAELIFSGLLEAGAPQGDWAVSLLHEDLEQLLDRLSVPLGLVASAERKVDLSALFRFGSDWSLQDLGGVLGPVSVLGGGFQSAGQETPGLTSDLSLSLGPVALRDWQWHGADEDAWSATILAFATDPWPLHGRLGLGVERLDGEGWALTALDLKAEPGDGEQNSLSLVGNLGEGRLETSLVRTDAQASFNATMKNLPLATLLPPLTGVAVPEGELTAAAKLSWDVGGLPLLLESLQGHLTAEGRVALRLDQSLQDDIPPARLGQRILQALVGDAAGGLARIANLTAGLVRLLERVVGQDFALTAALGAKAGRVDIQNATLSGGDILAAAEGWIDLATWQIDASWLLSFASQGGEPYYRERRSGPLSAPDILRDGLLFRGVTPPR